MPMLKTIIKANLPAGKYPIKLISFQEFVNDKGGYIQVTFQLPDRQVKHQVFNNEKALAYFGSTLKRQMGKEGEELDLEAVLNEAKAFDGLYTVISYHPQYGMNMAFHEEQSKTLDKEIDFDE